MRTDVDFMRSKGGNPRKSERAEIRVAARERIAHQQGARAGAAWRLVRGGLNLSLAEFRARGPCTLLPIEAPPSAAGGFAMAHIEPSCHGAFRAGLGDIVTFESTERIEVIEVLAEIQGATRCWPYLSVWVCRPREVDLVVFPDLSPVRHQRATNERAHLQVFCIPDQKTGKTPLPVGKLR